MNISDFSTDLGRLLKPLEHRFVFIPEGSRADETIIRSICADSRKADVDGLFVAVEGLVTDGHLFLEQAVAGGSVALICALGRVTQAQAEKLNVIVVEVENTGEAYALTAAEFFNNPAEKLCCIGITGTNGKTTVSYLVEQVLLSMGQAVGVIGTVSNRYSTPDGVIKKTPAELTTPDPLFLHGLLAEMAAAGVRYVVMEVSSHALVQCRVDPVKFHVAAFTNLSRDHLDYHGSMADYFSAKMRLFSEHLRRDGTAVIPVDERSLDTRELTGADSLDKVCEASCAQILRWGVGKNADVRLIDYFSELRCTSVEIVSGDKQYSFSTPLIGRFNVENLLTAFAIGRALALDEERMCEGFRKAVGAPGRLERVETGKRWNSEGPVVLVDYAHTPDALTKVLETLKELPHGELVCVFGCGGDRDKGKRPVMGRAAASLSSFCVVTDDNPRKEAPDTIINQIRVGVEEAKVTIRDEAWLSRREKGQAGCVVIRDRRRAIETAIRVAETGDIVLIAGKGHEPYQLTDKGKHYFDDAAEAREVLCSWTVKLLAEAVAGRIIHYLPGANLLGAVHTDSRLKEKNTIFVALLGDNHDGHDFARQAVENGAACIIVQKEIVLPNHLQASQILVGDTTEALGDLAAFRRAAMAENGSLVVLGITGSCGKTTVKEMAASILMRKWPAGENYPEDCVLKTQGNFNNLIGLPLSLLPLKVKHRAAVLEMGMNRPGELGRLGGIADPDVSCITNVYGAHLEGLKSIEGVARAKEELFQATGPSGKLVVNLDDAFISRMALNYSQEKITFSVDKTACIPAPDLWATDIDLDRSGVTTFILHFLDQQQPIVLSIAGEHNVSNALCASALGLAAGANLKQVAAGLADFCAPDKRMQIFTGRGGVTIINDTYNANPASMAAGLKTLKQLTKRCNGAILGDMLELGDSSASAHYDVGRLIARLELNYVAVTGNFKKNVEQGAVEAGFGKNRILVFEDKENAAGWILSLIDKKKLGQDDVLLVKASRGLRFETIVNLLGENTAKTGEALPT